MATAAALGVCTVLKIDRAEMIRLMNAEHAFSEVFLKFLLKRSMRTQADLVAQLFDPSEKRLARVLLPMAEFGKPGEPEQYIPKISQETLAEMVGTTRSRVSFFMNRFRKLGLIEYNGRMGSSSRCSMWCSTIILASLTPRDLPVRLLHEFDQRQTTSVGERPCNREAPDA